MTRVEVAVLGAPVVRVDGEVVALQGRQLVIVLRLALAGRVPLSRYSLLDSWPEGSGTDGALRVALTRIRAVLGADVVSRVGHGYVLDPVAEVDASAFVELARRSAEPGLHQVDRLALLDRALCLWTGDAFAGIERVAWVEHEVVRLSELREQSIDRRFELRLDVADAQQWADWVSDLVEAAHRRPEREHRAALAATALYRSGRQVEALALIANTRTVLGDSYGLDPGRELADLERAILRHEVAGQHSGITGAQSDAITSRLRAVNALLAAGVDEALTISRETLELVRDLDARECLGRTLLLTARAMRLVGDGDSRPLIAEARQIARAAADGELLARLALFDFGSGVPGDRRDAMIELAEPLDLLPPTSAVRVDLLCASAALVALTGSGPSAHRLIEAAEREHADVGSTRTEVLWLAARAIVSAVDGADPEHYRADTERALQLAESLDDPFLLTLAHQPALRLAYATGDLARVDAILMAMAEASEQALLAFGTVRTHLCAVTNAIARGDLGTVRPLLAEARAVGVRLKTHAVDAATAAQELLLDLELGELGRLGDELDVWADAEPASRAIVVAALARPHDDRCHARLLNGIDRLADDDARQVAMSLAALIAGDRRDAVLGRRCAAVLEPLGQRFVTAGLGTIALGPASMFTGIAHLAGGDLDQAQDLLERGVWLADASGAALWSAQSRLWLAESMLERSSSDRYVSDAAAHVRQACTPGRFNESWRVSRHAALLSSAIDQCVPPSLLRERVRRDLRVAEVEPTG